MCGLPPEGHELDHGCLERIVAQVDLVKELARHRVQ
jgi:hypothetical protein